MSRLLFIATLALLSLGSETKKIVAIKGESVLRYSLSHPLHKVEATSKDFLCEIEVAETKEIKSARVVADVMSFDSGNSNRDSHAMEIIDAFAHPDVSFASDEIAANGDALTISGKLTFHGVTKPIAIEATRRAQNGKTIIEGKMTVKLADYGVERPKLALIPTDEFLYISFVVVFPL